MNGELERLEERFREAISPDLPAIAWGVARGSETWTGAAGAATPQTPFSLASVTKPMTATAVMVLAERGLVDLDAPISGYLDAPLAGDVTEATVWRAADHTAGLPTHYQYFYADEPFSPPTPAETIRRYGRTFWTPGSRCLYSNLGYGMLGWLVERVSGRSYAAFMAEEVFGSLGMAHASIGDGLRFPAGAAVPRGEGFDYPPYTFDHPGASMGFASVEDLLAFGRFHLGGGAALLSTEGRRTMRRPRSGFDHAFGWRTDARGYVEHTGGMSGVRTILRLVPEHEIVLALVTNSDDDRLFRAADEILGALVPVLPAPPAPLADEPPPDALLGGWRGRVETYLGKISLEIEVGEGFRWRGGRLHGIVDEDVGTPDAGRRPYRLHLDLAPDGDRLEGAATAVSTNEPGGRRGNAMSYFARLAR